MLNTKRKKVIAGLFVSCLSGGIPSQALAQTDLIPDQYPAECQASSKTLPEWLRKLAVSGSASVTDYESREWYKAWEITTLSRCSDLTRARIAPFGDNKFLPIKAIHWRSDRMPLFRGGSGRSVDALFGKGFYPWKYDGNLDMPSGTDNHESGIINTGYWPNYIFELSYGIRQPGHQGYLVDAPGGINQTATDVVDNINHNGKGLLPTNVDEGYKLTSRNVVVFPGGIRREFIKGAFQINSKTHRLEYMANPHYPYSQPGPDEFDLVVADVGYGGIGASLSITPQGELVGGISHRYKKGEKVTVSVKNGFKDCWRVNTEARGQPDNISPYTLTKQDETLPVVVVYRGGC